MVAGSIPIIIPFVCKEKLYDDFELCINHIIENTTQIPYEIRIIASLKDDKFLDYLEKEYNVKIKRFEELLGYCKAVNIGIKDVLDSDYVAVLSSDIKVQDKWLKYLYDILSTHPQFGWVTCRIECSDGLIRPFNISASLFDMEALDRVGYFPEIYDNGRGFADDDLFMRFYINGYRPHGVYNAISHDNETCPGNTSATKELFSEQQINEMFIRNKSLFYKRWGLLSANLSNLPYIVIPEMQNINVDENTIKNAIDSLNKQSGECQSLSDYIDLAYNFNYDRLSIKPNQIKDEIKTFMNEIFIPHKPLTVCEIGSEAGGNLFLFSRYIPSNGYIISIDFNFYSCNWKVPIINSFHNNTILINENSQDDKTVDNLKKVLDSIGRKLDLLFIDGDHRYECVKRDFELYKQFVKDGGIIAFHDIVKYTLANVCNVHKFWNEIKDGYNHREIICKPRFSGNGIGVLWL